MGFCERFLTSSVSGLHPAVGYDGLFTSLVPPVRYGKRYRLKISAPAVPFVSVEKQDTFQSHSHKFSNPLIKERSEVCRLALLERPKSSVIR
jgi:hypothetical protein